MMIKKKALAGVAVLGLLAVVWAMAGRQTPGKTLEQEPTPPAVTVPASTPKATPTPTPAPVPTPTPAPTLEPTPEPTSEPTPQPLFEETQETRYTSTSANLRASYTVNSNKITTLPVNTEIKVIGIGLNNTEASGWSKIEFNGAEAYISSSLLSDFKIEIQQPVKVDKPVQQLQQSSQTTQPTQPSTVEIIKKINSLTDEQRQQIKAETGMEYGGSTDEELGADRDAAGFVPSAEGGFDRLPQGPVVVENTELILPE